MSLNVLADALRAHRKCVRDGAKMDLQPGIWVSQQVSRAGLLTENSGNLHLTGKLLTMNAYICPVCGVVEFVNEGGNYAG